MKSRWAIHGHCLEVSPPKLENRCGKKARTEENMSATLQRSGKFAQLITRDLGASTDEVYEVTPFLCLQSGHP